ncbi:DegT/DnrJ/EryC1/StrS family aminotransferase [Candidatus Woesearchaeota archaeon]|nr:DegT/DnrJ/EryC1/StrS family aminotransferase [Candidatus Woesearchaeota archaeon]
MIPIAKPFLGEEEKIAVLEVLDSGILAQGKKVREFEQQFAAFVGVQHAIATSNGTTALHAALLAHGIQEGDEVITSPFSFIATANAIRMCGATPVFVDIDEKTLNIDPELIEKNITKKTKALLPVHLFGLPADMGRITAIAERYQLAVIEDACQAHGAEVLGKKVGSFGTGCFSFYATKNMTTGEGGMITTDDSHIAEKVRRIINHGSSQKYHHEILGYNYRLTEIAAALGLAQLKKLPRYNEARKQNAAQLTALLRGIPGLILPVSHEGRVFHQYTLRITEKSAKNRDDVVHFLADHGIQAAVFYPVPIHKQKAYSGYETGSLPVAECIAKEVLSLPIHPGLGSEDLAYLAAHLHKALGEKD